jgi:hypothetical protein
LASSLLFLDTFEREKKKIETVERNEKRQEKSLFFSFMPFRMALCRLLFFLLLAVVGRARLSSANCRRLHEEVLYANFSSPVFRFVTWEIALIINGSATALMS